MVTLMSVITFLHPISVSIIIIIIIITKVQIIVTLHRKKVTWALYISK